MRFTSIAISGPVASGTTTAAKAVAEKLGLEYRSAGDFFRDYMLKHNIPLHKKEDLPDEVDEKFDDEATKILKSNKPIVFDGLYVGYFARDMDDVLKVLLTADEEARIKRALKRTHTHKETAKTIKLRDEAHDTKFRKLYANENFLDPKFFDLIIDTTNKSPKEVTKRILKEFSG